MKLKVPYPCHGCVYLAFDFDEKDHPIADCCIGHYLSRQHCPDFKEDENEAMPNAIWPAYGKGHIR
jgi:hypothetical protein